MVRINAPPRSLIAAPAVPPAGGPEPSTRPRSSSAPESANAIVRAARGTVCHRVGEGRPQRVRQAADDDHLDAGGTPVFPAAGPRHDRAREPEPGRLAEPP